MPSKLATDCSESPSKMATSDIGLVGLAVMGQVGIATLLLLLWLGLLGLIATPRKNQLLAVLSCAILLHCI